MNDVAPHVVSVLIAPDFLFSNFYKIQLNFNNEIMGPS